MSTLSQETMATVESTAPILEEHGLAITTHFYGRLFKEYPDVEPMFSGDGLQPERLAGAVLAYAQNIRNLEALGPAVERIAVKHVEAGVQALHYDIVGELLLGSMVEVLGEIDIAVVEAWGEAYEFLANIFIEAEAAKYAAAS